MKGWLFSKSKGSAHMLIQAFIGLCKKSIIIILNFVYSSVKLCQNIKSVDQEEQLHSLATKIISYLKVL